MTQTTFKSYAAIKNGLKTTIIMDIDTAVDLCLSLSLSFYLRGRGITAIIIIINLFTLHRVRMRVFQHYHCY